MTKIVQGQIRAIFFIFFDFIIFLSPIAVPFHEWARERFNNNLFFI